MTVLGDTSATELDSTNAKGLYTFDLTQAETNGDKLIFSGKSSTSNVTVVPQTIYTVPAGFTGSVAQTGDSFARVGAAGAGLTALGDARVAHLDADVSSRMATYTQPTGFLAATFPSGTIASTTNITAGTITTVTTTTTLTNLPAIPANWLTATGIAASALNGKGDWLLSSTYAAPLSAAAVRTAVGLASANLDTQLAAIDTDVLTRSTYAGGAVASVTGAVGSVTGNVGGSVASVAGAVGSVTAAVTVATVSAGAVTDASFTLPSDAAGPANGALGMLQQLFQRFFGKTVYDKNGNTLKTYLGNGSTRTTQVTASSSAADEVDAAS